ncbi:unnamed protein product [Effrenium voratum]|nr:unnamed protein product [Effrenium voratum]
MRMRSKRFILQMQRELGPFLSMAYIWHEPEEFLERAECCAHPLDDQDFLPGILQEAIQKVASTDSVVMAKRRLQQLLLVKTWARELASEEADLKERMHADVRKNMESKRICLFKKLLQVTSYPDLAVVDLLRDGFPLVGHQQCPEGFVAHVVPATTTEEDLSRSAAWRRRALIGKVQAVSEEDASALVKSAEEEVAAGFLDGPYSEASLTAKLGNPDWLVSPRFVLYQGARRKVRVIDDAKRSGLNRAYTSTFKLRLQDTDFVSMMAVATMKAQASLPPGVPREPWMGRTLDLKQAYKQLAVSPAHGRFAIVAFPIRGVWRFYRSLVLPFGATGSVYGFTRVSRALWHVLITFFHFVSSHYFDDFPILEPASGCGLASKILSSVLQLLGWAHAEGEKAVDFARTFTALGVTFSLERFPQGQLEVCNKEGRVEAIVSMLKEIKAAGAITRAAASVIQGHLNFALGYFTTKSLKHLAREFSQLADKSTAATSKQLQDLCNYACRMLGLMGPRLHCLSMDVRPLVVFTDGSWEDGVALGGMILIDPRGHRVVRQVNIPDSLVRLWTKDFGMSQIISQVELYVFVRVRLLYSSLLKDRRVLVWIDNESARACCIKAASASTTMQALTRVLHEMEFQSPSFIWYERVCSYSNPADLPSRRQEVEASGRFNLQTECPVQGHAELEDRISCLSKTPFLDVAPLTGVDS